MPNSVRSKAQAYLMRLGLGLIAAGIAGWLVVFRRWIPDPNNAADNRWLTLHLDFIIICGVTVIIIAYWRDLFPPDHSPPSSNQ